MVDWTKTIDALGRAHVACIGDIMLDRFVTGSVERISPEAPVAVLRVSQTSEDPGGVGNVARNIAALGGHVHLIAAVGDDGNARSLAELVRKSHNVTASFVTDASQPTTVKSRFVSSGHHMLRVDIDPTGPLHDATLEALKGAFARALDEATAVVLSDYGKGVLCRSILPDLIALARARRLPVIIDPKSSDYEVYRGASVVTPNLKELSDAVGRRVSGDAAISEAAQALTERFAINAVLVTRSEEGMTLVKRGQEAVHFRTDVAQVYDVAGAGDTVVATLAAGLAIDIPIESAVRLANTAAGIVVRKAGTAVAQTHELRSALLAQADGHGSKIVDRRRLMEQVDLWRLDGLRIGFANGCFDILHAGHIELLRKSRAAVDRLIVGLNADSSVQQLKGLSRPVNAEDARARVLAAIKYVDGVVLFDEQTPETLIKMLRPDVLIKGSDYTVETVVGGHFVQSYGGKVLIVDLVEGFSTTSIVRKLSTPRAD